MNTTTTPENKAANFLFGGRADQFRVQPMFIKTVNEGDLRKVKSFVQLGYDVNEKDSSGKCGLMYSIERGHESVFDYLLDKQADILAQDDEYKSVVDYIVESRNGRLFHKLLNKGLMKTETGVTQLRKALKLAADRKIEGMREMIVRAFQRERARRGAFKN